MQGKPSKKQEIIVDPLCSACLERGMATAASEKHRDNFLINSGIAVMQVKMGRTLEAGDGPGVQAGFCPPVFPLILAKACRQAKEIVCSPWNVA